jgi:hypothetical protein
MDEPLESRRQVPRRSPSDKATTSLWHDWAVYLAERPIPADFTVEVDESTSFSIISPSESECPWCEAKLEDRMVTDEGVILGDNFVHTSKFLSFQKTHFRVVSNPYVFADVHVLIKVCPSCQHFICPHDVSEGLFNFDNSLLLTLQLCRTLRACFQVDPPRGKKFLN